MKANAPENIYLLPDDRNSTGLSICWYEAPYSTGVIEYTRTDAFIEKAYSWLNNHYRDYMHNPTGERLEAFFGGDMCTDFKNYMKGE